MSELIERYRSASPGIIATSATLLTLVGLYRLFLQSRVGIAALSGLQRLTGSDDFEKVVWVAWLALGVSR